MRTLAALAIAALLAGCATRPQVDVRLPGMPPMVQPVPAGMQYLYGSGEGAAISVQAWHALTAYVAGQVCARPANSVVLAAGATLDAPRYVPCGAKPFAVVFDVDETVLLNLGFEYDASGGRPYDQARWAAWERTGTQLAAVPGAKEALDALRTLGVTVVFNTNRSAANAGATAAALDRAGLGPAVHGESLFLAGDDASGSRKDGRRATIATRWCVLAMGGDQLGDFSDLFNTVAPQSPAGRRAATLAGPVAARWGAGWFMLPNPVYGTALAGSADDVFPPATRWAPSPVQEK